MLLLLPLVLRSFFRMDSGFQYPESMMSATRCVFSNHHLLPLSQWKYKLMFRCVIPKFWMSDSRLPTALSLSNRVLINWLAFASMFVLIWNMVKGCLMFFSRKIFGNYVSTCISKKTSLLWRTWEMGAVGVASTFFAGNTPLSTSSS